METESVTATEALDTFTLTLFSVGFGALRSTHVRKSFGLNTICAHVTLLMWIVGLARAIRPEEKTVSVRGLLRALDCNGLALVLPTPIPANSTTGALVIPQATYWKTCLKI